MKKASDLKKRLTDQQAKAAYLLVENDFELQGRRTFEEIAEEVGVSRSQLYIWRQNPDFIAYQSSLSDAHLEAFRAKADRKLMELIDKGYTKALDLYYTLLGRKVTRTETTTDVRQEIGPRLSESEIARELEKLQQSIKDSE